MRKSRMVVVVLFFGLLFLNLYGYGLNTHATTDQLENFSISGTIPSGISNLYITQQYHYDLFGAGNYTYSWNQNTSQGIINMSLVGVGVVVTDLRDPPYQKVITNNISNPQFAVLEGVFDTAQARMAQYFVLDNFSLINNIRIFINTTISGVGYFQIDFFNASDFGEGAVNINTHTVSLSGGPYTQWQQININEYFQAGAYFAVVSSWVTAWSNPAMNNNSWLIHEYSNSNENKGASLFENSSGWFSIPADDTADFLLEINAVHYPSPYDVNLSASIDNETHQLYHKYDSSVKVGQLGRPVWRSELMYYLPEPVSHNPELRILINRTIGGRIVVSGGRYYYDEPTNGTFFANFTRIQWNVDYKKVNSSNNLQVFFKFPSDWTPRKFVSSVGMEVIEYGIYYSYIYGERGNALLIEDHGDGTQTFEYSTIFTSTNYLLTDGINAPREVYLGDSFTVRATIKDSEGDLVTNGNCSFYLFNSNGVQIYSAHKINTNGTVAADRLSTNGWGFGKYSMAVVWSNGEQIGITLYSFNVSLNPWIIVGIVAAIVAAATAIVLTYGRRKLAERNWEKSIQHLLVISKNGAPMYSYSFGPTIKDSALISGMISAIASFMQETTGSTKPLRVIDQEDKKIILSHGKLASVAILTTKDLKIIHEHARAFLAAFEMKYQDKIVKWTGDTDIFKGTNKLIEEHFPVALETVLIGRAGFQLQKYRELIETAEEKEIITATLSEITELLDKYQDLILKHYGKLLNEIINKAHEKLS